LSSKQVREFLQSAPAYLTKDLSKKPKIEITILPTGDQLFFADGTPIVIMTKNVFIPPLTALLEGTVRLPKIVVDMGAVPFVVKGATVMAPGICSIDPPVKAGETVVVVDETHNKPLAVGKMLRSSEEILQQKRGPAVSNLHHVSDGIWVVLTT